MNTEHHEEREHTTNHYTTTTTEYHITWDYWPAIFGFALGVLTGWLVL